MAKKKAVKSKKLSKSKIVAKKVSKVVKKASLKKVNSKSKKASKSVKHISHKSNSHSSKPAKALSSMDAVRKKVFDFLELKDTKRIAIIADNDQDGLTSAVQMKKFLSSKKVESQVFFYDHYTRNFSFPKEIFIKFNAEKTIFLDLNENFISEILIQFGKFTGPFLVIDHHQGEVIRNNSFRCTVVKPKNFSSVEPSKYPVTKMVYDIFGGVDWVCSIGVIGDFAFEQWRDFLSQTEKKHSLSFAKLKTLDDIVACVTSQYPEKINSLFNFISNAKSPNDLLSSEYIALKKLFDQKLEHLRQKFYQNADCYEDAQVCFFNADTRFSGKLSNILSAENKNKLIIVLEQPGSLVKCSIRRHDYAVNCSEVAKAGVAGTNQGNGGGHIPAAGASFPPHYLDEFKKRVRMYLLQNPPKIVE
ncbi:MAG: DHHA1 domain-containing protein [archaeon]